MTLLIDPPNVPAYGRMWSHLASDESFDELHAFASSLGIPRHGFDRDHYDVPGERYDDVVAAGAVPVPSRDLLARLARAGLRRRKADALGPRRPGAPLVRPERLRPGDTVAVVAPSGPVTEERLAAGLDVLRAWGLDVRVLGHVRGADPKLDYLAAGDDERAGDFMTAWTDPQVRAVFCARGGYGAQRMVDRLDWSALRQAGPKLLVGFSDITGLHLASASRLGLVTVHGPVVTSLGAGDDASREQLRRLLFEPAGVTELARAPGGLVVGGSADGVLVGGNAALLASSVGTPDARPAAGSVAVLEDVSEEPYKLDRLLTQLLRSGWFDDVRGIAVGQLLDCGAPGVVQAVVEDRLGSLGVPVLCDLPFGHVPGNLAVPLGVRARLDADHGTLTLLQDALR